MERKTYLIIGASSDVGLSYIEHISERSSESKPLIIAHYFSNSRKLEELNERLSNVEIVPISCDLSSEEETAKFVDEIINKYETINYFIHMPATKFDYMRMKDLDTDQIKSELNVSLFSFLNFAKALLPKMKNVEASRVLVMLTEYVSHELPPKFMTDYIVTKYALLGAMKAAAAEYGGKKLLINSISPIMMDTKFLDNMDPRIKEMNAHNSSIGRIIKPSEIAVFMDKLLCEDCEYNGYNLTLSEQDFK